MNQLHRTIIKLANLSISGPSLGRTTTAMTQFNMYEYCSSTYSRNLTWEWTKAGTEVVQKCPGGTFGKFQVPFFKILFQCYQF